MDDKRDRPRAAERSRWKDRRSSYQPSQLDPEWEDKAAQYKAKKRAYKEAKSRHRSEKDRWLDTFFGAASTQEQILQAKLDTKQAIKDRKAEWKKAKAAWKEEQARLKAERGDNVSKWEIWQETKEKCMHDQDVERWKEVVNSDMPSFPLLRIRRLVQQAQMARHCHVGQEIRAEQQYLRGKIGEKLAAIRMGQLNASAGQYGEYVLPPTDASSTSVLNSDTRSPLVALQEAVEKQIVRHATAMSTSEPRFGVFPIARYQFSTGRRALMRESGQPNALSYVNGIDSVDGQPVILTKVVKGSESSAKLLCSHLEIISNRPYFQGLRAVWDAGSCYVVVQDDADAWQNLDKWALESTQMRHGKLGEMHLQSLSFQLLSMIQYLHAQGVSLAGNLHQEYLRMAQNELKVLVRPDALLAGYAFVPATKSNMVEDVRAVGRLMLYMALLPTHAVVETSRMSLRQVMLFIKRKLGHLSETCKKLLTDCLSDAPPSADELLRRQWLRKVNFLHFAPHGDVVAVNPMARQRFSSSLIIKVGTLLTLGLLSSASWKTSAAMEPAIEEEEPEGLRQRSQKTSRRSMAARKLLQATGTGSPHWLKRGALVMPSLGSSVLPDESKETKSTSSILSIAAELEEHARSQDALKVTTSPTYDEFDLVDESEPEYDVFDEDTDSVTSLQDEDYSLEVTSKASVPSRQIAHDPRLSKAIWRSIHVDTSARVEPDRVEDDLSSWLEQDETDNVLFSAFGPSHVGHQDTFRIDIWAYIKQQRSQMLETAHEWNESEAGRQISPMQLTRGTLVTVHIEANDVFGVHGDETKGFRWKGDVTGISFAFYRKPSTNGKRYADEVIIARVAAGTNVSLLYIRLNASSVDKTAYSMGLLDIYVEQVRETVTMIQSNDLAVHGPIGQGHFGDALLATWQSTGRDVVVKTLRHDAYAASDAVAEMRHEAAVMHMLGKHPHVVELVGLTDDPHTSSNLSIVTEYLPNGTIQDHLNSKSYDPSVFARTLMARDAAHGLANVHQGGLLHRDVAARNCLLDANLRVKIADFGLARKLHAPLSSSFWFDDMQNGFGPLKWMAPESILPPHLFSKSSDAYMYGVLMYEIFTGKAPFPTLSTREATALIVEGRHVSIPETLPRTHRSLMERCFRPHPLERPSLEEVYASLDRWLVADTSAQVQLNGFH